MTHCPCAGIRRGLCLPITSEPQESHIREAHTLAQVNEEPDTIRASAGVVAPQPNVQRCYL